MAGSKNIYSCSPYLVGNRIHCDRCDRETYRSLAEYDEEEDEE